MKTWGENAGPILLPHSGANAPPVHLTGVAIPLVTTQFVRL